ncbi:hypothetical protein LZ575_10480 [Antarcticibacterium sp. 1MA-6-2]|uniref:M56 family metallopeptidase n=1 Tax=Antarcticibacterium sp. 1MA-6-2 TaxID=2908210 RepID=UPI001F3CD494|nr:M56 family metallopeptidase [Antarcticibacterium sp. 1MA-6-2]UJH92805.1 hypothetical protein LZ575_10480 [Antarcticibacterium sp. 1MA-6-2]
MGVLCFIFRFFKNLLYLKKLVETNDKVVERISTKVLLPFRQIPYSYFRYIFVEKDAFKSNQIPKEILKHEEAHVQQNHTLDLLILEILQIIFWFNPLFYFIKRSMRLNHEFMADEAVLKQKNIIPADYLNLLINSSYGINQTIMTSSFKNSLIKKRVVMISNSFSKKRARLKIGFIVPVLCCCIYFFNNDIVAHPIPVDEREVNTAENEPNLSNSADSLIYGRINYLQSEGKAHKGFRVITNRWAIKNRKDKIVGDKKLDILIQDQKIQVNGKAVNVDEFVQVINSITHTWTKEDAMLYKLSVSLDSKENPVYSRLSMRFTETDLFKMDPSHGMYIYETNPNEVIQQIQEIGGNIYLNDEKISRQKASGLLENPNAYSFIKHLDESNNKMALWIWDQVNTTDNKSANDQFEKNTPGINEAGKDFKQVVNSLRSINAYSAQNDWIHLYVEKDKSIGINGRKTDLQSLTQRLTELTQYSQNERKKYLKLILIVDPRITMDHINEINKVIQEYGVYSMIGHSIIEPPKGMSNYPTSIVKYNRILKLPVREQQTFDFSVSYDLLGKGYSTKDIEDSFKKSLGSIPTTRNNLEDRSTSQPVGEQKEIVRGFPDVKKDSKRKIEDQEAKVRGRKQIIKQIRENMVNSVNELIEKGDVVTYFEDGKEITASKAFNLAKEVEIGNRDMILTTISGSKTPVIWANLRSLVIHSDSGFSFKYEEEYPEGKFFE